MSNKTEARGLIVFMAVLIVGSAFMVQPVLADSSYNNVQVFATTSSNQAYNFQFAAYNLTGSLIASYQTSYPAAAFELPNGGYLFTVSATHFNSYANYPCPVEGAGTANGAGATGAAGAATPSNGSSSVAIMPVCYRPSSEYGYATASIAGPQTVDVKMQNVTQLPTTAVTVKVSYVNGTAAAGASVYGSIVGEWYYWWGQGSSVVMGAQTDSSGTARLVLPVAPTVVTAWSWVPIFTGKNDSTIETNVGGQKVNVTVYWQPTYVGLSGSGLLLPPQNSINLTLHYQQPDYWVMPMGVTAKGAYVGSAPAATVASQPNGTPSLAPTNSGAQGSSQYYLPSQIPSIQQSAIQPSTGTQPGISGVDTLLAASALFIAAALGVAIIATRHRIKKPSPATG
jgi:hypothetical protein